MGARGTPPGPAWESRDAGKAWEAAHFIKEFWGFLSEGLVCG